MDGFKFFKWLDNLTFEISLPLSICHHYQDNFSAKILSKTKQVKYLLSKNNLAKQYFADRRGLCRLASKNKMGWSNYITFTVSRLATAKSCRCRDLPLQVQSQVRVGPVPRKPCVLLYIINMVTYRHKVSYYKDFILDIPYMQ